jgi:hypothetical protein
LRPEFLDRSRVPNTDRRVEHRLAQLAPAPALLLTAKLIGWRYRHTPGR